MRKKFTLARDTKVALLNKVLVSRSCLDSKTPSAGMDDRLLSRSCLGGTFT